MRAVKESGRSTEMAYIDCQVGHGHNLRSPRLWSKFSSGSIGYSVETQVPRTSALGKLASLCRYPVLPPIVACRSPNPGRLSHLLLLLSLSLSLSLSSPRLFFIPPPIALVSHSTAHLVRLVPRFVCFSTFSSTICRRPSWSGLKNALGLSTLASTFRYSSFALPLDLAEALGPKVC